ncbi:MAG: right-handed parallel beta-helix repeat-containing protein [Treponemataceae bacterium]|nr:right-handed parallel beta-helix repeat-containing protein [Treponemataceae bacterium]
MQKGKRIFHVLATLLAILPIASCRMDSGNIKTASQEEGQHTENTIIIRTNVSAEEYMATNARSAVPSQFLDTDGKQLVFAGALYASTSQEEDKIFQKGEYNKNSVTLAFESANEERKDYTLEIRAYKGETESFDGTPLLCGTTTITIAANNREINAPAIKLKPFESATEKGNINLEILIPSEYPLSIEAEGGGSDFSPTIKYNTLENGYTKCTISASGIKAGIYEVDFLLWNSDRTNVVYLWNEAINIYPGMTTDKWNTGSVKDGARQIDKARIFSTFYVKGENPQSKWFQTLDSSTEENGSLSHPYTKIQDAIDRVVSINDGSIPFSIYIDGTLTQDEVPSGEGMANFSVLNKNLTLTIKSLSDEKATLDADGKSRVINAKPASVGNLNLTLEKLVIKNGNVADTNNGGGIFIYGGTFTIEDCEITDNNAQNGGGLYVERTTLLMKDTTISGSTATDEGGGVYVNDGTLTINGGTFSKNTAQQGGGMYVTNSNSIFTMAGGEISDNRAYSAGGGIYVKESKQATISGTTISVNTANVDGGGVFVSDGAMLMVNGTITGNTAQQGGGVYVREDNSEFKMTGGKISENKTTVEPATTQNRISGGGIFIYNNGQAIIENTEISDNTANNNGGGVYVNNGTLTMNTGTIGGNTANVNGGGIYVTDGATVTMSGGTIGGNKASQDGGGVYITGNTDNASTFKMNDGKIGDENIAQNGGGVYVNDNSTFTMSGGEIKSNKAIKDDARYPGQGGGVYVYSATFEISGTAKISGNDAAQSGGGIYVYTDSANATLIMSGGEISGNTTTNNGGGVYNQNSNFIMSGGKIDGNTAGNTASSDSNGGGIYLNASTFTMSGGEICENTSLNKGGGVFLVGTTATSKSTFTMGGGTISENTAKNNDSNSPNGDGGGVSINSYGEFTLNSGTISGNKAVYGAGVHVNDGTFTMGNGTISGNTASDSKNSGGGGIHLFRGTFTMNGGTVSGNEATGTDPDSGGGGIYIYSDNNTTFTITGGTFKENKASRGKGAFLCKKNGNTGNLCMSGTAKFESNNDVYLYASAEDMPTITVAGALTAEALVATITPSNYTEDKQVLSADNDTTMQNNYNKFAVTKENDVTKWKIVPYESNKKYGILKKDSVSTEGGISVTLSGQGTYTLVVAGSTEITEDSNLQSGTITLREVKKDGTLLPANDYTFTIEIRDESGNPFPNESATGLPGTVTVPTVPVEQKAQVYVKVLLKDDGPIIEKTIPVTIRP